MVKPPWFILLLSACTPTLAVRTASPGTIDEHANTVVMQECEATTHVRVTDATGAPVVGALVAVRQVSHDNCPSMGPFPTLYTTAPVRTNSHGVATTCAPATFFRDKDNFCPHHLDEPTIVVVAGDRGALLGAPFDPAPRATLSSCADLRARDPEFPCGSPAAGGDFVSTPPVASPL